MSTEASGLRAVDSLLDQLAQGVIVGQDDLVGLGECITLIEGIEGAGSALPHWKKNTLVELKQVVRRIILEESPNLERDWQAIPALIGKLCSDGAEMDPLEVWADEPEAGSDLGGGKEEAGEPEDSVSREMQDPELLKDFVEEAREHLSNVELGMLVLEKDPGDLDAINEVFRPFHSIKGVAGFLNLTAIHQLTHEVENLLDEARSSKIRITDAVIDVVLHAVDILKELLMDLQEPSGMPGRAQATSAIVKAFVEQIHTLQAGGGEVRSATPSRTRTESRGDGGSRGPGAAERAAEPSASTAGKRAEGLPREEPAEAREASRAFRETQRLKENAEIVRVDTHKLDSLIDMVGELVIAQSMVLQNGEVQKIQDQKLQKDRVHLHRITSELQRISMSMRMVPIKATFQKMIRLVRDLSKKSGKDVALVMKGEETEIDRKLVEEIYEPLVHMIRNAVDHGIETPEERVRIGKEPQGTITLCAEQKSGSIVIDIRDDGRGVDAEKVRAKAIRQGLISETNDLDERALYELIFHPGFSTKETVTEVSGRGVGMDVVKRAIDRLRGKVEILSTPGKGTHFIFRLPLTMAIIDGMVIRVGAERYIVPTVALKESLRPPQSAYLTVQGKGELINARNHLMPLIRLHRLFQVEPVHDNPWEALVLVVGEDDKHYCLLADEIIGRQEVVIKNLGSSMRNLTGVAGGAILGDGKVALIVDVKGVISLHEEGGE